MKKKKKKEKRKKNNRNKKRILQIKNVSLMTKWGIFVGGVLLNRDSKPCQSTPGGSGLDLGSTTATILTPDMPVAPIPTGVAGPLPESIVRFVLRHSSLSFQEIFGDAWCSRF